MFRGERCREARSSDFSAFMAGSLPPARPGSRNSTNYLGRGGAQDSRVYRFIVSVARSVSCARPPFALQPPSPKEGLHDLGGGRADAKLSYKVHAEHPDTRRRHPRTARTRTRIEHKPRTDQPRIQQGSIPKPTQLQNESTQIQTKPSLIGTNSQKNCADKHFPEH